MYRDSLFTSKSFVWELALELGKCKLCVELERGGVFVTVCGCFCVFFVYISSAVVPAIIACVDGV